MGYAVTSWERFKKVFKGNSSGYGSTTLLEPDEDGKVQVKCQTIKEQLLPVTIQRHLEGKESIGISPLQENSTCHFAVIDIDRYDFDLMDIVRAIYDFGMPLFPCYSKSKGLHIYMFFEEDIDAHNAQNLAHQYVSLFCLDPKTEVFPKQTSVTDTTKYPSWINLPYFNVLDENNHRKLINKDGSLCLSLEEALDRAMGMTLTYDNHVMFIKEHLPYSDAPPCVTSGILLRDVGKGFRNAWLFSVGVYLCLSEREDDLEEILMDINSSLHEPIPEHELKETVVTGLGRKTYFYKCNDCFRCNKKACAEKKEFGIGTPRATGIEYGQLTRVHTDPMYYKWVINDYEMTFSNQKELRNQESFRGQCMDHLNILPRKLKGDDWDSIVQKAMTNIADEVVEEGDNDFTPGSLFKRHVSDFFWKKKPAENILQCALGRIYKDDENGLFYYRPADLVSYITTTCGFKEYTNAEIRVRLVKMGSTQTGDTWAIPSANIKVPLDVVNKDKIIESIEFNDGENEDDIF